MRNSTVKSMEGESMNPEWQTRTYEKPVFVQDANSHQRANIDVDYTVILKYMSGEDVWVGMIQTGPGGRMQGMISRANRIGARGDRRLAKNATVEFEEKQVFRLEKAT